MAGTRWAIEECFQTAKNEAGLDHYQVRTFRASHITLALLAAGWLAVTRAHEHQVGRTEDERAEKTSPVDGQRPVPVDGPAALSVRTSTY